MPLDPDLNRYDLNHVTTDHPVMTRDQWRDAFQDAWRRFYSVEHIKTLMRRGRTNGLSPGHILGSCLTVYFYAVIQGLQPLEGGLFRRRARRERRPGWPVESPLVFYPKYLGRGLAGYARVLARLIPLAIERRRLKRDPEAKHYRDRALTPVDDRELAAMALYSATEAARNAVAAHKDRPRRRARSVAPRDP